jgi:hypothetical protein
VQLNLGEILQRTLPGLDYELVDSESPARGGLVRAMENRGSIHAGILRLHPNLNVSFSGDSHDAFQAATSERLYGPQDYALIGYQPALIAP